VHRYSLSLLCTNVQFLERHHDLATCVQPKKLGRKLSIFLPYCRKIFERSSASPLFSHPQPLYHPSLRVPLGVNFSLRLSAVLTPLFSSIPAFHPANPPPKTAFSIHLHAFRIYRNHGCFLGLAILCDIASKYCGDNRTAATVEAVSLCLKTGKIGLCYPTVRALLQFSFVKPRWWHRINTAKGARIRGVNLTAAPLEPRALAVNTVVKNNGCLHSMYIGRTNPHPRKREKKDP